jgi:hypothetical protein
MIREPLLIRPHLHSRGFVRLSPVFLLFAQEIHVPHTKLRKEQSKRSVFACFAFSAFFALTRFLLFPREEKTSTAQRTLRTRRTQGRQGRHSLRLPSPAAKIYLPEDLQRRPVVLRPATPRSSAQPRATPHPALLAALRLCARLVLRCLYWNADYILGISLLTDLQATKRQLRPMG